MSVATTFLTKQFDVPLPKPDTEYRKIAEDETFTRIASTAGYYFEGCVYSVLSCLGADKGASPSAMFPADGAQGSAKRRFSNPKTFGFARVAGGGIEIYIQQSLKELQQNIEAAAIQTGTALYKEVVAELGKKNYTVELTQGGNPLGDIVVKELDNALNGKQIVLELKYQLSTGSKVRWFELDDSSLFGANNFAQFLDANRSIYWTYKQRPQTWTLATRRAALENFLQYRISGGAPEVYRYLLQKGSFMAQNQRKKIVYARTGGGTQVSMTLDLDALADLVSDIQQKIDSKNATLQFIAATPFSDGDTEIGTFSLSKFKHNGSSEGPIGDKFAFDMYLSQKLFN